MNDENKLMEGEIMAEEDIENAQNNQKTQAPSVSIPRKIAQLDPKQITNKVALVKKPKFITLVIIFFLIFLGLIGLIVLSSKPNEEQIVDPAIFITSPKPTPQISEERKKINEEIEKYEKKVNALDDSIKSYPLPKVDLDIEF